MEMTFNQYVDTLCECIDNAIYNYNIEVMVEAADGEDSEKSSKRFAKLKAIADGAVAVFKKVWKALLELIRKVEMKVLGFRKPFAVTKDIEVSEGAIKFDAKLCSMIDKGLFTENNIEMYEAKEYVDDYKPSVKNIKEGTVITVSNLENLISKYKFAVSKFKDESDALHSIYEDEIHKSFVDDNYTPEHNHFIILTKEKIVRDGSKILRQYIRDINTLLANAKEYAEAAKKEDAKPMKEMIDKANSKEIDKYNESIDISALRASLLSEAARLLDEDAACYVNGIDGGDVLSDGLPSEKPVVDDEYPADDVTGGYGDGTDETPIEDLVDNDALDILKADKGSVDPTVPVTESVVIRF